MKTKSTFKILFSALLMIIFSNVNAQKYSFVYEYRFKPDSLHLEHIEKELMTLAVDGDESIFISTAKIKRDSAIANKKVNMGNSMDMSVSLKDFPNPKVSGIIFKNRKKNEVISYKIAGGDRFKIMDKPTFQWKITGDKAVILGKNCQKATVNFRGRNYDAWFTDEIPITDGPYKFSGLPGLILKIEDTKKQHVWEIVAIQKYKTIKYNFSNYTTATEDQVKKAQQHFADDPYYKLRQFYQTHGISPGKSETTFPDGTKMNDVEYEKFRKAQLQNELKTNNNSIELTK